MPVFYSILLVLSLFIYSRYASSMVLSTLLGKKPLVKKHPLLWRNPPAIIDLFLRRCELHSCVLLLVVFSILPAFIKRTSGSLAFLRPQGSKPIGNSLPTFMKLPSIGSTLFVPFLAVHNVIYAHFIFIGETESRKH